MTALPPGRLWESATRPETLLEMLQQTSPGFLYCAGPDVRRFACWCARDAGAESGGPLSHRVLYAAEKYADGKLPAALLAAERQSAVHMVIGATRFGLPQRHPTAALRLAAIRTADEDPFEAARAAAHYSALAAVFREGESAGVVTRMRQASALRFFIPNPFISEESRRYVVA